MPSIEDVLTATRIKLLANPEFAALVGTDIGTDSLWRDGWVFPGIGKFNAPEVIPRNTGQAAVAYQIRRSWGSPNPHNNARFKLLDFSIYADQTRGADKSLTFKKDSDARCHRIAEALVSAFHDAGNVNHWWTPQTFVVSSLLYEDVVIGDVENEVGMVEGTMSFALELG